MDILEDKDLVGKTLFRYKIKKKLNKTCTKIFQELECNKLCNSLFLLEKKRGYRNFNNHIAKLGNSRKGK